MKILPQHQPVEMQTGRAPSTPQGLAMHLQFLLGHVHQWCAVHLLLLLLAYVAGQRLQPLVPSLTHGLR